MNITLKDIEKNIKAVRLPNNKDFIFDLLAAYGRSQGNITRLRNGQLNVADNPEIEVAQKGVVYFKLADVPDDELYVIIDDLKNSSTVVRYSTRFVIVTNYRKLLAIDTKTGEPLDINLKEINKHYTYFLPWAGMEKAQFISENHADVKAAEKMAKLFDTLVSYNGYKTAEDWHHLTTFFTRLLFCFFAEDVNIFKKNQFTNAIASYTQKDGSDLRVFLTDLFKSLDDEKKQGYPSHFSEFPYVNGRLFRESTLIPKFNKESRDILIELSSKLDWSGINPDIFGSMFQAVVRPGTRTGLGQHYTSVPNIMKNIEPLFLDELKDVFNSAYDDNKKLNRLLDRISNIKIFDPACGSGNFLIIAYKELRKLEHAILERLGELSGGTQQILTGSRVNISNFYGIEIDDFAYEVAILSLWLAKHQMNIEFTNKFGMELSLIPLKESGNIIHGNATHINWQEVCHNNGKDEIYLISNPPYQGYSLQDDNQKKDIEIVFKGTENYRSLDYISCWFKKGADYIRGTNAQLAFVSTNSICQGEQVYLLWPKIMDKLEIGFAYTSFKWGNNAKGSAGITCIIVSLRNSSKSNKVIYADDRKLIVKNINTYLSAAEDIPMQKRSKPISNLPQMLRGSGPIDGGHLLLDKDEKNRLINTYSEIVVFIKRYMGSDDFINDKDRWCLWITDGTLKKALEYPPIKEKILAVKAFRLSSKKKATQRLAEKPYLFGEIRYKNASSIIVPRVFSAQREYITAGYLDSNTVIADSASMILNAKPYIFGIVSSRMHMLWTKAVCGQLRTDIRYSSQLSYNNFPFPNITENEKKALEKSTFAILDAREHNSEMTLAELYNPKNMPRDLLEAHNELDNVIDKIYRTKQFENDEERLAHLFNLYKKMVT